uniref:Uncharacterized protein n=1 Tax=Rhizophora mucronata TaxID=61149 RepID=A0A2P2J4W6_RHIMU
MFVRVSRITSTDLFLFFRD